MGRREEEVREEDKGEVNERESGIMETNQTRNKESKRSKRWESIQQYRKMVLETCETIVGYLRSVLLYSGSLFEAHLGDPKEKPKECTQLSLLGFLTQQSFEHLKLCREIKMKMRKTERLDASTLFIIENSLFMIDLHLNEVFSPVQLGKLTDTSLFIEELEKQVSSTSELREDSFTVKLIHRIISRCKSLRERNFTPSKSRRILSWTLADCTIARISKKAVFNSSHFSFLKYGLINLPFFFGSTKTEIGRR